MHSRSRATLRLIALGTASLCGSVLSAACLLDPYGAIDPDGPCTPGASAPCYSGPPGTRGVGRCVAGTRVCRFDGTFGACVGEVLPRRENCSTPDDEDCDGLGREDPECRCDAGEKTPCATGKLGICAEGTRTCAADGKGFGVCTPDRAPAPENCATALDEDCDGFAPACTGDVLLGASRGDMAADVAFAIATNGIVTATAGVAHGDVNVRDVSSGAMALERRVGGLDVAWSLEVPSSLGRAASRGVAVTPAGDVIAVGEFAGNMNFGDQVGIASTLGSPDAFVVSVDAAGKARWAKAFGDGQAQVANAVAAGPNGRIAVAGTANGAIDFGGGLSVASGADAFVAVFDYKGEHVWSKLFGDAAPQRAFGVAFAKDGDVILVGEFDGTIDFGDGLSLASGDSDGYVVRLSGETGLPQWHVRLGNDAAEQRPYAVAVGPSGEVAVAGEFGGSITVSGKTITSASQHDAFVVVLEQDGALRFAKALGNAAGTDQVASGLAFDAAGNVVVTGSFDGAIDMGAIPVASAGGVDAFIAKYSGVDGRLLWLKVAGGIGPQRGWGVATLPDSSMLVSGGFAGMLDFAGLAKPLVSQGALDMFVVHVAP